MAGTTGLEPATSAVTGQRSNQLSYVPFGQDWSGRATRSHHQSLVKGWAQDDRKNIVVHPSTFDSECIRGALTASRNNACLGLAAVHPGQPEDTEP